MQIPLVVGQDCFKVRKHTRISTGMDEIAAIPLDGNIFYIAQAISVGASSPTDSKGRSLFTIFQYSKKGRSKKQFQGAFVSRFHDGPVSFTGDGKTMVFSQQRPVEGGSLPTLGIYFAENFEGIWTNIHHYEHNDPEASLFTPTVSADGQTLFFAANFEDSFGGYDLYVSKFRNGSWTPPENLGPSINTEKNELYPFIHRSGKLFFSSGGHDNSTDGIDLFESSLENGQWIKARKMSTPINSKANDIHIYFNDDFSSGYLTSDRMGGSKDIFTIEAKGL